MLPPHEASASFPAAPTARAR